ncbi:uncharacterized protein BJX67DRAFT_391711 [Aspergillus lucknowensis]|uniref:Uncharacterized protein n=1 Tax=Aspergillus lucknowensis TaxID=176173 RepID=A0ABR4L8U2_9EURO
MQPGQENQQSEPSRPGTPPRPPYSPVTPVLAHLTPVRDPSTAPNGTQHPIIPPAASPSPTSQAPPYPSLSSSLPPPPIPASFAPEPPPVPISESENPDAIALRSAISILQLQKQQGLRDIQTLERMKEAAAQYPEKFARELAEGKLSRKDQGGFIDFSHEEEENETGSPAEGQKSDGLGTLPTPQNVVRMPPINWAKYQIVGESLDKMHEEEQRRPSLGEPRRDELAQRAPEYTLASPYRPLVDKLESPTKAKGTSKSKKG